MDYFYATLSPPRLSPKFPKFNPGNLGFLIGGASGCIYSDSSYESSNKNNF